MIAEYNVVFLLWQCALPSMSELLPQLEKTPSIAPIEQFLVSSEFDGSEGTNRAESSRPLTGVKNDIEAIRAWLTRYTETKTTFDNYRKEAERLLLWSTIQLRKPLSSLTHEDLCAYQYFLIDPQPTEFWVMQSGRRFARSHPEWRPFVGPLSSASQRQSTIILSTLFSWLVNAGYLAGNPLSLSRRRTRKAQPRLTRYLEEDLWNEVKTTLEMMPKESKRDRKHYSRIRWLFSSLYLCGLRISEVVENTMGDFFYRRDRHGNECWWLEVIGKGRKTRIVPATSELMTELARY